MQQRFFARDAIDALAFAAWLRGGAVPPDIAELADEIEPDEPLETKGNPYHDPKNDQFTFAPGGPRARGYQGMTKHGRDVIQPVGGGGTDRNGRPRPELFAPDPYALKTPAEALAHYMGGLGEERNYYLQKVDMSDLSIDSFLQMRDLVADGKPGVYRIAGAEGSSNGGRLGKNINTSSAATVGGLKLVADGALVIAPNGSYRFSGRLTAKPDLYNFDWRKGRSPIGQASTTMGSQLPGKPYWINMIGSQPITIRGARQ